jgi:hypothetical protein
MYVTETVAGFTSAILSRSLRVASEMHVNRRAHFNPLNMSR